MPRSIFLGRPLPGPGEPLWTNEDRSYAMALLEIEADSCPGCGQPLSESMHADAEGRYTAEIVRCHACAAGAQRTDSFQKNKGDARGAHVRVTKREGSQWPTGPSMSG